MAAAENLLFIVMRVLVVNANYWIFINGSKSRERFFQNRKISPWLYCILTFAVVMECSNLLFGNYPTFHHVVIYHCKWLIPDDESASCICNHCNLVPWSPMIGMWVAFPTIMTTQPLYIDERCFFHFLSHSDSHAIIYMDLYPHVSTIHV